MPYVIPASIQQQIETLVANGEYENEEIVLQKAIDALIWRQREEQKIRQWNKRNRRSIEESRQGLSNPLDLDALLSRVEKRVTEDGRG